MNLSSLKPANQLSVQQIRTFCKVYEQENYSSVASELVLSVPAIWEQVRMIERYYNLVLFKKVGRRITRTPSAAILYQLLAPILNTLDSTFNIIEEQFNSSQREMSIVAGTRMVLEDLVVPLRMFHELHSQVKLSFIQGDSRSTESLIKSGKAEIGLTLAPGLDIHQHGFEYHPVYDLDYLAVCLPSHPLAKKKRVSLKEIIQHPLIVQHKDTYGRKILEQALFRNNLLDQLKIAVETDNSVFTMACVSAGLGVGFMAGRSDADLESNFHRIPLTKEIGPAKIVLVRLSGRLLSPIEVDFVNCIKQHLAT